VKTKNAIETIELGKKLGELIRYHQNKIKTIHLQGNLGTGKTTISKGIMEGMGYSGLVKSPTFALVEIYESKESTIFHFDLYRINSEGELLDIGIQEYLDQQNAISIFEWPKKGGAALPPPCIEIILNNDENHQDSRLIELRFKRSLNELKKAVDLFLQAGVSSIN